MSDKIYTLAEASSFLNKHPKTLQMWDREGTLKARRTKTNRRFYYEKDLNSFIGQELEEKSDNRKNIVYCRVSSQNQRPDLKNQRKVLEDFLLAKGLSDFEFIEEIGGGLNFKRPKFLGLVNSIMNKEIKTLVIAHKDRLMRFGFDLFAFICKENNCEIIILNTEQLSPEQEMVQDLMAITHCFSSRLYGLRNYRKNLKEALK